MEKSQIVKPYFKKFENILVNFRITEYSKNIRVILVDIDWNDIGSFNIFDEIFPRDKNVVRRQEIRNLDLKDNIVIFDEVEISLHGVSDLVVKVLMARKNRTQYVKKLIKVG